MGRYALAINLFDAISHSQSQTRDFLSPSYTSNPTVILVLSGEMAKSRIPAPLKFPGRFFDADGHQLGGESVYCGNGGLERLKNSA